MAITATAYGPFILALGNADIDLSAGTYKCSLHTSSYVPNFDTDDFFNDVTNEITGTGYTAGGVTLSGVTWTYDSTNNWGILEVSSAPTWSTATFTARQAVVYKSTGTSSTSQLICCVDFGANRSPAAVDFVLNFSQGIIRLRAG